MYATRVKKVKNYVSKAVETKEVSALRNQLQALKNRLAKVEGGGEQQSKTKTK